MKIDQELMNYLRLVGKITDGSSADGSDRYEESLRPQYS